MKDHSLGAIGKWHSNRTDRNQEPDTDQTIPDGSR